MAEIRTEIDLLDSWFRLADRDGDGVLGGNEAVEFFQRSGLSKEPLYQIWNVVANNNPYLSKQQFYTAMRLVSAAQRSGGKLSEAEARSILIGLGPPLPPPTMVGLEQSKSVVTQISTQAQHLHTNDVPADKAFPPMTGDDVQHYQGLFARLDDDRTGYVLGKDCFEAFMQWGLPKDVLRDTWNLVAGNHGQLDARQFISCVYLMDMVKKGCKLPEVLPSTNFPPFVFRGGTDVAVSDIMAERADFDIFSSQLSIPSVPTRATFISDQPAGRPSRVPAADSTLLESLEYADRQRLETERAESTILDRNHAKAEADMASAKQQQAFYKQHLQELTIFKAKSSAALLQAEEWAARERIEAEAIQQHYDSTYLQAKGQFEGPVALLQDIQAARARKLELQTRLDGLQRDLAELSSLTPVQLRSENAEIQLLVESIALTEARLKQQDVRSSANRAAIAKFDECSRCSADTSNEADKVLLDLDRQLTILKSNAGLTTDSNYELCRLLSFAADTYNNLVDQAVEAEVQLPADAQPRVPSPNMRLEWTDTIAALASNWHDFNDDGLKILVSTVEYSRTAAVADAKRTKEALAKACATADVSNGTVACSADSSESQ